MTTPPYLAYRKRMQRAGLTRFERNMKIKSHEFDKFFADTLDKESCVIDGIPTEAVFQDHSQANNKDLSDDKWLVLPNETKASVGSYVSWRDQQWLVFTKETKTIPTHQQMKIKHVNQSIKWIIDGQVCNGGLGWGAYVQNQTLYTLGVSTTGHFLQVANAKMMLYMQKNDETSLLKTNDRIYVGDNVYKIKFRDIVSRVGLINCLLEEDTTNTVSDNDELKIADYWNKDGDEVNIDPPVEDLPDFEIDGDVKARCGRSYVYHVIDPEHPKEYIKVTDWVLENMEDMPFYVLERSDTVLNVRIKDDSRLIGTTATITAFVDNKQQTPVTKALSIISKY